MDTNNVRQLDSAPSNHANNDSDDDLEQVAAVQRSLVIPHITTVKEANAWIAKPNAEKTGWVDISMCLFSMRKFARGWYLTLIDRKRSANFATAKTSLECLPFTIRKKYLVSITLYLALTRTDRWRSLISRI